MKTLTAFNQTKIDSPYVDLIRLVQIDFTGLSLYLCDRIFGDPGSECVFNGQLYEPLVLDWGTLRKGRIDPITWEVAPGEFEFILDNITPVAGVARFTALFATYDPHFASVTYSEIFAGASAAGDRIDHFVGSIEDLGELSASRLTVYCSGLELDIAAKFSHTILNTDDYPGADPDDLGKLVPQIYGNVRRSPCLAVDAGGKTTIAEAMTAASPGNSDTLEFTDASKFPAAGAFTAQVDDEQIRIASRSGNTCTLAASGARGYDSTNAVPHDDGAAVFEIQTEYIYLIADHAVKSIDAAYVDDVKRETGFTAYTGYQIDSYTKLLLHMDGADASTTFTDHGATGHTVTANGDAQIDTAQKKFGTASGLFDGNDYLQIADHADWDFGSDPFTIDFWVRFNTLPATTDDQVFWAHYEDGFNRAWFRIYNDAGTYELRIWVYDATVLIIQREATWSTPVVDTWYHIALIRGWGGNADSWAITVDGTAIDTFTDDSAYPALAGPVYIGYLSGGGLDGWMDELRISKGIARWTANFTPRADAYLHGDSKSGYEGKAALVFDTLPLLKKQVNADVDSSGRVPIDSGHVHSTGGGSTGTVTAEFQTHTVLYGTVNNPANVYDGSSATQASFSGSSGGNPAKLEVKRTTDLPGTSGTPRRWRMGLHTGTLLGYKATGYGLNGSYQFPSTDNTLLYSPWYNVYTQTWAYVNGRLKATNWCDVTTNDLGTSYKYIKRFFIEIEYETEASPTDSGIAAVEVTGSNVLSGNTTAETVIGRRVAVDCGGVADDIDGTITGTPDAIIERPDHELEDLLLNRCGLSGVIHSASYAAAGSYYAGNSFRLGVPILQPPNVRRLLNRIAHQARSIEFWEAGEHHLAHVPHPADSDTKLLLHLNGSDGATTFEDHGATGHTVTANGDAQIDTAQKKFGTGSGLFDGTGDYLQIADHADWLLGGGSGNFTIDLWVYFDDLASDQTLIAQHEDGNQYWSLWFDNDAGGDMLKFEQKDIGGGTAILISADVSAIITATQTWHHIAVVRGWSGNANDYAITVDGTAAGTGTDSDPILNHAGDLYIGSLGAGTYFNGQIDEARISHTARWTANFTPPSRPYPYGGTVGGASLSADKTIDAARIDLNQIRIKYTGRWAVQNSLSARYARDWSGYEDVVESDRAVVSATDRDSIARYGTLKGQQLTWPYVIDQAQAQAVLDRARDELADVGLIIEFPGGYYLADVERGDIIDFDFEAGDELDQALLGLVQPDEDLFRVIDQIHRPDAAIQIELVKAV